MTAEPLTLAPLTLTPVAPKRRVTGLDSLRGFALLGVLIVNVYQVYAEVFTQTDMQVSDQIRLLGEGTFYPIFSLLFGFGFALQLAKGEAALPLFRRRLLFLLLFGLVHGVFIWEGDILSSYALIGFLLAALYRWPRPLLLLLVIAGWALSFVLLSPLIEDASIYIDNDALYASGSYWAITRVRAVAFADSLIGGLLAFSGFILGLFILGFLLGRRGVGKVMSDKRLLWLTLLFSLAVAVPLLRAYYQGRSWGIPGEWWFVLEYLIASPFLGFAYLAGLSLIMLTSFGAALMKPFSYVGRMALSNYLGQSVICTLIFYGYGLGRLGELGTLTSLYISLALFLGQMIFSYLWLLRFRYGPMEWLWRSLTYSKVQPIRYPLRENSNITYVER